MHSDLSVHYSYPLLVPLPQKEKRIKKKKKRNIHPVQFVLFMCSLVHGPVPSGQSPKDNRAPSQSHAGSHRPWIAIFQHLYHNSECLSLIASHLYFQKNIIGWNYMKCVSIIYIPAPTPRTYSLLCCHNIFQNSPHVHCIHTSFNSTTDSKPC